MNRLAKTYKHGPDGKFVEDKPLIETCPQPGRGIEAGGAGIFSTAGDFARFAQMLLNGGTLDGHRILGRKTIELMTANHMVTLPNNQVSMPLQNPGGSDLVVSGVTIDSPQFRWVAPSLPFTLPPGGQTNLVFQFAPTSLGAQTATATFQSNGAIAKTLSLSGRAEERENFFIEAEDFNFGGGQHRAEADLMPHLGGAYAGLSAVAEVDYHDPSGNESAAYRPSNQKVPTTASTDVDRGSYPVTVDYKVGWNDAGDWYNYTRKFPAAGADYHLFARLSTGCAAPPAGLVSWWVGEGNARDVARTNAGTINGGVTFVAGEVGQAFHFNGKDASVKIPAAPSLNVGAGSGLTVEAWINPDDVTAQAPIVESNNGSFGAHLWIFAKPAFNIRSVCQVL